MAFAIPSMMLTVCDTSVPQSDVAYVAYRIAFLETLERVMLADQIGIGERQFGFLTEVPFLRSVPPQVQLDCLLETWHKHHSPLSIRATLADESVIYAVCETAARVVSMEPQTARRLLRSGPREVHLDIDQRLSQALQDYHVNLPNEGDFLLISQFLDVPPDEALPIKHKFGMSLTECDVMFELLGRWHISPEFGNNSAGLLTPIELSLALRNLRSSRSLKSY